AWPREQPRSRIVVLGWTGRQATSKQAWRITSYCGIDRRSMSSKTCVTSASNDHFSPGRCPRLLAELLAVLGIVKSPRIQERGRNRRLQPQAVLKGDLGPAGNMLG